MLKGAKMLPGTAEWGILVNYTQQLSCYIYLKLLLVKLS